MPMWCWLLLAHFLVDWCWQSSFIAENKHKMWMIMFAHCAAWSLALGAVLSYFEAFAWWKLVMLFVIHWIEDLWKAKKVADVNALGIAYPPFQLSGFYIDQYDYWKHKYFTWLLTIDQSVHIVQIAVCVIF